MKMQGKKEGQQQRQALGGRHAKSD